MEILKYFEVKLRSFIKHMVGIVLYHPSVKIELGELKYLQFGQKSSKAVMQKEDIRTWPISLFV